MFLKLIKGLFIYKVKVKRLVLLGKVVKRLGNPAIIFNKTLVEVTEP